MMIPLLADLPAPSANYLLEFLLTLSLILNLLSAGFQIVGGRRTQKREVTYATEFQLKGDYALNADLRAIEQRLDTLMERAEERAINLHNRINPVVENTANIKGQMEGLIAALTSNLVRKEK